MRIAALLAIVTALAGCASSPAAVSLALNPDLAKVVLLAEVDGIACRDISFWLATKTPEGYQTRNKVIPKFNFITHIGPDKPLILPLEPGEYHLVNMHCQSGDDLYKVGDAGAQMGLTNWTYPHSYASFRVNSEKMLDLGMLVFTMAPERVSHIGTRPMPQETHRFLQGLYPEAHAQMVSRPFTIPDPNPGGEKGAVESKRNPQTATIKIAPVRR